ncbi:chemotaxis protein CheW [Luteimonas aestuarii]|uniref:Chemotaxis protein CheW n=1 Tax=Luteimonas aestuarii TaxID=453837 RepID=A0A4R5TSY8_9GAMM|nr:chemotaxis protein CheW [Luteimonas aestuarii]TDK21694.1 chemotaxis protein CheW [Luteimonas aestuarii]
MNTPLRDIRGVLIQTESARLLLPNATISEVLSYADPEPVENAPDWLLGRIRWRGWRLPLVAFAPLAGLGKEAGGLGSKVIVLKALGGEAAMPYFALLTKGFPRLVTVSRDALLESPGDADAGDDGNGLPQGVSARVRFGDDVAYVPDIDGIEGALREALAA